MGFALPLRRPVHTARFTAIRTPTVSGSGDNNAEDAVIAVLQRMRNLSPEESSAIARFVTSMWDDRVWQKLDDFWCFHLNEVDHGTGWKEFYVYPFNGTALLSHSVQKGITREPGGNQAFGVYEISVGQSSFRRYSADLSRSSWGMTFSDYTYAGNETFGWCSIEENSVGGHMLRRRHSDNQLLFSVSQDQAGRSTQQPADIPADWNIINLSRVASNGNINYYEGGGSAKYQDTSGTAPLGTTTNKAVFPGGRNEVGVINNVRGCSISELHFGSELLSADLTNFQTHYETLLDDLGVVRT